MNNFIRYWNKNRKEIIKIIAIIAVIIIFIQLLNNLLKDTVEGSDTEKTSTIDIQKPTQSVITGEEVSEQLTEKNTNLIKEFVNYCNSKEVQKAYNLLSDDCKAEFENNINLFISNYYNKIFETEKTYSLELWISTSNTYTYRIKYYEDNLLATGGSTMNKNIEDYITIVEKNNESKININGLIKVEEINKSETVSNVEIIINSRKIYKNYETYNISVKNNTSKSILLSDGNNNKDICLVDKNDVEYLSFLNEIYSDKLYINPNQKLDIDINFNKIHDIYRIINKIKFDNIILNAQEYTNDSENVEKEQISITIDI